MAAKGLAVGRTNGNGVSHGAGSPVSRGVASEFDRSIKRAGYVEDIPMPVIVIDCDHNIEYLNRAAALMAGIAPEASVGLKMWDLFDFEACHNGTCVAARAMREGRPLNSDGEYTVKGRKIPVRTFASPRYDDQNKVAGVIQIFYDNTEDARFAGELARLAKAALDGQLRERGKAEEFQGRNRDLMAGINGMLDAIVGPLNVAAGYVERISRGDIPEKITESYNGDFNTIKNDLNQCVDGLGALQEATAVTQRMSENDYTKSVDGNYVGIFADLAAGINGAQKRVRHVTETIKKISQGNMEDLAEYKKIGKRSENDDVVPSLTVLMENINAMVADAETLEKAAVEGKLETRADASKHQGEFRNVVQGLNDTLDAVIGPLKDVSAILNKLAGGDFTALVTSKYAGDFDLLANAVNTLSKTVRSALEHIGQNVSALAGASEELNKVSQSMGSSADETATQASVVSAAAEQVSNNVQTVATGADEMGASIKEIAKNTAEATRVASSAVRTAETTNETISKLGQSSAEIGQVIKVITTIAQQTNLLALNATIEAARAGEAGKGFAVVANEVKELAKETAKATEDISRKIEAIQGDTNGAVSAIGQISQVIGQISDIQTTIASAIEEQSATTNEIGRTLAEAAKGSTDISKNIGGVAEAARATTVGAMDTSKSAQSLEKMAAELRTLVSQFRF